MKRGVTVHGVVSRGAFVHCLHKNPKQRRRMEPDMKVGEEASAVLSVLVYIPVGG